MQGINKTHPTPLGSVVPRLGWSTLDPLLMFRRSKVGGYWKEWESWTRFEKE